ncbi:MAG: hypothetical protein ACYTKD_14615 [Planctomycetota bacterium]|jgi:hypothetical protein
MGATTVRGRAALACCAAVASVAGLAGAKEVRVEPHGIWVPDSVQDGGLRGLIIHRDYGAEPKCYSRASWRSFAEELKFGQVLFAPASGRGKKDPVSGAQGSNDVKRLDKFLKAVAPKVGHTGLERLPFVTAGVSRGGANSIMMAYACPERAIAAIGHHGISGVGIRPHPVIPVLYTLAGNDPTRNPKIEPYVRDRVRKGSGAPWTLHLHRGARHNSTGDDAFTFAWLRAVVEMRLAGKRGLSADVWSGCYWGNFVLEGAATTNASFTKCRIAARPNKVRRGSRVYLVPLVKSRWVWLPSKDVAEAWLSAHGGAGPEKRETVTR